MDINLIVLVAFIPLFIAAVVIGSVLMRNSTLEKLPLLPGEKILLEETGVRVDQMLRGKGISTIYTKCRVRLTDRRIITAQTPWFGKNKNYLRHVVHYVGTGPELSTHGGIFLNNATVMRGYLTLFTTPERITVETIKNQPVLKITAPLRDPGFLKEPRILIYTKNISAFEKALSTVPKK